MAARKPSSRMAASMSYGKRPAVDIKKVTVKVATNKRKMMSYGSG